MSFAKAAQWWVQAQPTGLLGEHRSVIRVASFLLGQADPDRIVSRSHKAIAAAVGMDIRTAQDATRRLRDIEWMELAREGGGKRKGGDGLPNSYVIRDVIAAKAEAVETARETEQ